MKKSISILLTLAVSLLVVPAMVGADPGYDSSLLLENKDETSNWAIIDDNISGTLEYNSTGWEFEFKLTTEGLTPDYYSLIYYADFSGDRFGTWGGDNPGAVIATFHINSDPWTSDDMSVDLGMDLPSPPDANISYHNYCGAPDNYTNCHGAKIWLVPSSALSSGPALPVTAWPPDDYWLFETNLIWYDDFSVGSAGPVGLTVTVPDIIAISVTPSSLDFGTLIPGSTSDVFEIIVTNVGTNPVNVDASLDTSSADLFKNNLKMRYDASGLWYLLPWTNVITNLAMNSSDYVRTRLSVPDNYTPQGSESGTLVFEAAAV